MLSVGKFKGRTSWLLSPISQPGFVVQRDNECAVYAGRKANVYMDPATIPSWIKNWWWARWTPKGRKKEARSEMACFKVQNKCNVSCVLSARSIEKNRSMTWVSSGVQFVGHASRLWWDRVCDICKFRPATTGMKGVISALLLLLKHIQNLFTGVYIKIIIMQRIKIILKKSWWMINIIILRLNCRILVNLIVYIKRTALSNLLRINKWMDTTHANELDRSILMKWANPHAVHMLLMHSLIKEVSFSWLAFQGASHVTIGLKVSATHWCSISPPTPMGNGLSGGISSFNPGLLCGSRRDKARAGLACVVTVGWLVLFGGKLLVVRESFNDLACCIISGRM